MPDGLSLSIQWQIWRNLNGNCKHQMTEPSVILRTELTTFTTLVK